MMGYFYTPNRAWGESFEDCPGSQHNGACGISFADGHAEMHKWQGKFSNLPVRSNYTINVGVPMTDPDMLWLANRTPVR